ncbi:hypothetical protein JOE31_001295 [Arthrobacter sp. PvP023]|uniref:hypothetical protein n=1 Tax=Micrococcaceae TaxID=1268 RepID=UPI001AE81E79|nr:hypothetical protein [Arthrobacter sp. PvP023]MBP1135063.1 hypothetical protein [Arthrobacter sp. PvP023]
MSVHLTISPVTPAAGDVSVSISWAEVGGVSVSPALKRTGTTFSAAFTCVVPAGTTQVDVDLGGHSYRGRNSDHRDFALNAEVILQEHGKQAPTFLFAGALIHL